MPLEPQSSMDKREGSRIKHSSGVLVRVAKILPRGFSSHPSADPKKEMPRTHPSLNCF